MADLFDEDFNFSDALTPFDGSNFEGIVSSGQNPVDAAQEVPSASGDTRIKLHCLPNQEQQVYGDNTPNNILSILYQTGGMMFPYTPTISMSQSASYTTTELTHANGGFESYSGTPNVSIEVADAKFTVQNQREGLYALACIHLLRTVSKMYFGEKDKANKRAGLPPPVMRFSGYGNYVFNDLPVLVKSHSFSFAENMDTVLIRTPSGGTARLPAMFSLNINLVVQQTPQRMRKVFSLDEFRTGALLNTPDKSGTGWI